MTDPTDTAAVPTTSADDDLGAAWAAVCDALRDATAIVAAPDAPLDAAGRARGYRYLGRLAAAGLRVCLELDDPDRPAFGRMIDRGMTWGLDNPDCLYLYAGIGPGRTYRITGHRGSATMLEFQANAGHFGSGDPLSWRTVSSVSADDLVCAPDGTFELIVGGPPRDHNWLATDDSVTHILFRQYFGDWEHEDPATAIIERLDAPLPVPEPSPAETRARLDRLAGWLGPGARFWDDWMRALAAKPNALSVFTAPGADAAALHGLVYGVGSWRCAPDEAVIFETRLPRCRYFSFTVMDWFNQSQEFAGRQTHLNHTQAHLEPDGTFRGVIAHADPGVPNWLDPVGAEAGGFFCRFLLPEAPVPEPAFRVVPAAEVRAALPPDTPTVTPAERAEILARRRRAALRRYSS